MQRYALSSLLCCCSSVLGMLTPWDGKALLGFRKTVKGLDGHDIVIARTAVTQPGSFSPLPLSRFLFSVTHSVFPPPGFVQVVHGEGLPIYHGSDRTFPFTYPGSLSEPT